MIIIILVICFGGVHPSKTKISYDSAWEKRSIYSKGQSEKIYCFNMMVTKKRIIMKCDLKINIKNHNYPELKKWWLW
mgnify:CR=1 FL=1